jgi:hypothetical protein
MPTLVVGVAPAAKGIMVRLTRFPKTLEDVLFHEAPRRLAPYGNGPKIAYNDKSRRT